MKQTGFNYTLEIENESVEYFAKAVLQLVNIKSSHKDVILDIETIAGTNIIGVIALEDIDNVLEQYGSVRKESIDIITVDEFPAKVNKVLDKLDNEGSEFFLHYPYKGEFF